MIVIVMGVSGAGKTTVGGLLARKLDAEFLEGDRFHPPANVEKMRRGEALVDADRRPWLEAIAAELARLAASGRSAVLACSALKRAYRRILVGSCQTSRLVYLRGSEADIRARLEARRGHYMPPSLLPSQFAALEEPGPEERPIVLDIREPPEILAARAHAALAAAGSAEDQQPVNRGHAPGNPAMQG